LTGITFPLTKFPDDCQTLKNKKNKFLEFGFLETYKALTVVSVLLFYNNNKKLKSL
jgi:hypothetical protein